jgi:predicted metal-dependent phosphoesterase TrpH
VQGIEIINANRTDFENEMAKQYADNYGFFYFAGTDNHVGGAQKKFAGMESDTPIVDENDFIERVRASKMQVFAWTREE